MPETPPPAPETPGEGIKLFSQQTSTLSNTQPSANLAYQALEYARKEIEGGRPDTRIQIAWLCPENPLEYTAQALYDLDTASIGVKLGTINFHGARINTQPRMIALLTVLKAHEERIITSKSVQTAGNREGEYATNHAAALTATTDFRSLWGRSGIYSLHLLRNLIAKIRFVPASSLPLATNVLGTINRDPENPTYTLTSDVFSDASLEEMEMEQLKALAIGYLIYMILHDDYSLEEAMSTVIDIYNRKGVASTIHALE